MNCTMMVVAAIVLILFARYQFRQAYENHYDSGIQVVVGLVAFLAALVLLVSLLVTEVQ